MLMVKQQEVNMLDTNIPDNPEPVWDSGTNYNKGDRVQWNNFVYESLIDNNQGNQPDESLDWYKVTPINKWACLDGFTDTATEYTDSIYYKFKVSDIDTVAFFGLQAESIDIKVTNNLTGDVYTQHLDLVYYPITDWWEWTYSTPVYKKDAYVYQQTMFYDATLEITINKGNFDTCKVAFLVYGRSTNLGITQYGAKASRRTIVKKERSPDGRIYTQVGIKYKRISVPVILQNGSIDAVLNKLDEINGEPALFIGDDGAGKFESLLVYGFFKDFDVAIDPVLSTYELEIEGVG